MSADSKPNIPSWKAWVISARPKTLVATAGPLIISTAYLWQLLGEYLPGFFPWERVALVWIACFILQIACNLTNDYYDTVRGADNEERIGPKRMLQMGFISKEEILWGLCLTYAGFFAIALWLSLTLTWGILPMAVISMAAAFFYTGGKYPLSYFGLGDVFAFWFFGPLFTLIVIFVTGYGLAPFDVLAAFLLGLSPGFFSLALININNIRDLKQDRKAGKITLAQRWGRVRALWLMSGAFALSMIIPYFVALIYGRGGAPILAIFLLPAIVFTLWALRVKGEEFNRMIGFSAGAFLLETVVFSLVWLY